MTTDDVIKFFGSQRLAATAMGLAQPSISNWGDYPPDIRQLQLERLTKRKLKAEPGCLDRILSLNTRKAAA
jgi:hypothetical protein